jgi:hypothetical protein
MKDFAHWLFCRYHEEEIRCCIRYMQEPFQFKQGNMNEGAAYVLRELDLDRD